MLSLDKFSIQGLSLGAILFLALSAGAAYAASPSDIHITPDGKFSATNVVVFQKSGKANFFSRVTWGTAFVRVTILAHDDTVITKAHGEPATVDEIKDKDVLDVEGTLSSGDGALVINATRIRDTMLQVESKTISGTVASVNPDSSSLILSNNVFGATTTVKISPSTTIQKGVRTIVISDISSGDKVLSASGTYDYTTNTFTAVSIEIFQDKKMFIPRNFQGTLKSISGTTLPTTLTVEVGATDYIVYIAEGSDIWNIRRKPASLSRFVVGDTVRFYGGIRTTNLTEIDAEIVRDLNF